LSKLGQLEKEIKQIEKQIEEKIEAEKHRLPEDPLVFFQEQLGFQPTRYQKELTKFFMENQFVAACWSRQSGKSHTISANLLYYALKHPETYIAVVGPSWRQTKLIIRRINSFLRRLPKGYYNRPQRTIVRLKNGSVIEAFPNNPETIRGPTLNVVYCDEMNFIREDEELYDAILFTLVTTDGKFICSSTPGTTDSIFYRIFHDKAFRDFKKSRVTWKDSVRPKGPLSKRTLNKIRRQYVGDPWRWQREMEAEWGEDEDCYLPLSLITNCIDSDLEYIPFEARTKGRFYVGVDLGKKRDFSVVAVFEEVEGEYYLVHLHRFKLGTPYAGVIGYVKALSERLTTVEKVCVDQTGVGEYIVEEMRKVVSRTQGVLLSLPKKEEVMSYLKQSMSIGLCRACKKEVEVIYFEKARTEVRKNCPMCNVPVHPRLHIPHDEELEAEMNVERFELTKEGRLKFSHPEATHDDRLWAVVLALSGTMKTEAPSRLVRAY
jgi:hypothetical protein